MQCGFSAIAELLVLIDDREKEMNVAECDKKVKSVVTKVLVLVWTIVFTSIVNMPAYLSIHVILCPVHLMAVLYIMC